MERLAKRAGLDVESWIGDAIADYAEELGVDPRDLSERERQEAVEDAIARAEAERPARREPEPEPRYRDHEPESRRREPEPEPRYRDHEPEMRRREPEPEPRRRPAFRDEEDQRPRRPESPRAERSRLEEAIARIESRAVDTRADERSRLDAALEEIERRAERHEERTARALESLSGLVDTRGGDRHRLESVVSEIEKRAERNERRTAQALESLHGLVEKSGGERDRLQEAIAKVEARAERNADRTAKALESLTGLIESRKGERERLEAAIERVGKRAEETESRTAKALESLTHFVQPAHRDDVVAAKLDALAQRAARSPVAAPSDDDETFRLVSERLARRRKAREPEAAPAPQAPPYAGDDTQRELRRLADKVDSLSTAAAAKEAERAQGQAKEIETALAAAAQKSAQVERMERQVVQLAQLVERLVGASPAPAEMAQATRALADVRSEIDRLAPGPAIQALDRRVEDLSRRIEAAAKRPAVDLKPFDDLARRVEAMRVLLERQAASRPDSAALLGAMQTLNEKIDRAAQSGAQSTSLLTSLQSMVGRFEEALQRPAVDLKPFEELSRRVDSIRVAVERQAASHPDAHAMLGAIQNLSDKIDRAANSGAQSASLLNSLQGMVSRLEETMHRPAAFDDIARRIDGVRGAVERQGSLSPKVDALHAALGEISAKVDRAPAPSPEIERLEAQLRQLARQVETALSRSAVIDMQPFEDLARRIESLRMSRETQGAASGQIERLEAQLAEIRARLDHPAEMPAIEAVGAALRKLSTRVDEAVARPAFDARPIEDLARRVDAMKGAAERGFAPHAARLEAALGELSAKVEEAANRPAGAALDGAPIEDLARRVEAVKGAAERGFAPHAARLEAALGELSARVQEAANRPVSVALDPKPIEDLARRIERVRQSLENPPTLAPHVERLESVLDRVAEKLDQAGPVIDANGINSTLAAMNARLEEAFRRPAQSELSHEPIAALAARVEAVQETVERQTERLDGVRPPLDELTRRLEALRESVERQARSFDPERVVDAVRDVLQTHRSLGGDNSALTAAIETLAAKLDMGPAGFNAAHIETLLQEALQRPAVNPAHLDALADAVADLAEKVESPAAETKRLGALMERIDAKLDRPAEPSAELGALIEIVSGLASRSSAPDVDVKRLEAQLEALHARLDRSGVEPGDLAAIAEAVGELGHKLERAGGSPNFSVLEDLTREVSFRLDTLEAKIDDRALSAPASVNTASLELALREMTEKISEIRVAADTRGVEKEIRELQGRIEEVADTRMSSAFIEQAAQALARDVGDRISAATPDVLVDLIRDIHDRIDMIGSAKPAPALEGALRELADELEALRSARDLVDKGVATLTDLRQEQSQFDRRMDARFSGVQEILEKLVDRLGRLEREIAAEGSRPAAPAPASPRPPAQSRAAMLDIPDRGPGETRGPVPLAEAEPLAAQVAAQARGRETAEPVSAKAAALNAHIAAARRAASAAAADMERREEAATRDASEKSVASGLAGRAGALFNQHRRPVLLGAAGLMTVLTGVAVLEMRSGHRPERKTGLEAPATTSTPLSMAPPAAQAIDETPTGAIATEPKVITAPIAPPRLAPKADAAKPSAALISNLPQGLGTGLIAASASGDLGAEIEVAQRFLEGRTVPRDPKIAAEWLRAAADTGSAFAQYRLAALYEKGVGVTRDLEKARTLYKAAADAGNARAMHNLAVLYAQDGGNGKPDYAAAMGWFRKAADYGVRDSQFNLGVLFGRGLGATQDLAQSWMWFSLAAKQGDSDAARKRDEVATRMDGRVMTAAKKAFDDYKAKTPDPAVNDPPPLPAAAAESPAPEAPKAATSVKG